MSYNPQKLYWEEKFSTGDENIDFQHQYLFDTFNKLGDAILQRQEAAQINAILGRLQFYADWHFAKEEECMLRYQCPAAQTNKRAHEAFRELFSAYREELAQKGGSVELAARVHASLSDWLKNHIMTVDVALRERIGKKE